MDREAVGEVFLDCPCPQWVQESPPSLAAPRGPTCSWGGGVALGGPSNLSHCEFRGQRGIPGREGGGRFCGRLLAWTLLGPPRSPGSGPGAMNSDSGPCPCVSTRAATNTHTSTPGLLPATALPPPQVAHPAPLPAPVASSTQGVASDLQATGSRLPGTQHLGTRKF